MKPLSLFEQLAIGLWLSAAVAIGVLTRSVESAFSTVVAGAFFTAPLFALRGLNASSKGIRWASGAFLVCALLFVLVNVLSVFERVYLVNGKNYPAWLATEQFESIDNAKLNELRNSYCKNESLELFEKEESVVVRCGLAWYMPSTKTFIAKSHSLFSGDTK